MITLYPEYDSYIAPDGEVLTFDRMSDRFVQSFEGYGMSPIKYVEQQGALQHGTTIYDYKLQRRIIQWTIRQSGCSRWDYWEKRELFLDLLRPNRHTLNNFGPGKLRKLLPDGNMRDINVHIEFGPMFSSPTGYWDEWGFTESLRFIAPDPTFYDPTLKSVTLDLSVAPADLVFPITFPITLGEALVDTTSNIVYGGSWLAYPTLIITGPISGFRITNEATEEFIQISHELDSGDTITISLPYGNKEVIHSNGTDLQGSVSPGSDLATFHLAPSPEAVGGTNPITILGAGAGDITSLEIQHKERYIGI